MTTPSNKEYLLTEIVINARDDGSKQNLWPDIYAECAQIQKISCVNPFKSIRKATSLSFCLKINLDRNSYQYDRVPENQFRLYPKTPGALPTDHYVLVGDESRNIVLYFSIPIPAGDYSITELMDYIKTTFNANYEKNLKISNLEGVYGNLKNSSPTPNELLDYTFIYKMKMDYSITNGKINWVFNNWIQSSEFLAESTEVGGSGPRTVQPTDSLILHVETEKYHMQFFGNMIHHDMFVSGERWLLEKLGFHVSEEYTPIRYGDVGALLFKRYSQPFLMGNTITTGFNSATGWSGASYPNYEIIGCSNPSIFDLTLGNGMYLCLSNFGNTKNLLYDTRGSSTNAVCYINAKKYPYGYVIEEKPKKFLNLGTKVLHNTFKLFFVDEENVEIDKRDLNYVVHLLLFSKNTQVFK